MGEVISKTSYYEERGSDRIQFKCFIIFISIIQVLENFGNCRIMESITCLKSNVAPHSCNK